MLRFLRGLFRRDHGPTRPIFLDVYVAGHRQTRRIMARKGSHLCLEFPEGDRMLFARHDACDKKQFDLALASISLGPMFLEDGTEVDPSEFY